MEKTYLSSNDLKVANSFFKGFSVPESKGTSVEFQCEGIIAKSTENFKTELTDKQITQAIKNKSPIALFADCINPATGKQYSVPVNGDLAKLFLGFPCKVLATVYENKNGVRCYNIKSVTSA